MSSSPLAHFLDRQPCDHTALAACTYDPAQLVDDHFDYSRVVVRKPWGYEYLIYQNESVAVWILFLKAGAATSLHCHPNKTTALAVLHGSARCATLEQETLRQAGEGLLIGRGVFHRTTALSPEGAFVMEIETPVNKRDLVRYRDAYGRESLGYESAEHTTVNVSNYNYISFVTPTIFYNVRKRFGDTSLRLIKAAATQRLDPLLSPSGGELLGILRGRVRDRSGNFAAPGDLLAALPADRGPFEVDGDFEAVVVSTRDRTVRAADLIVSHLQARRVTSFFFAPGTSNAHLVDAIAREPELSFIPQTSDAGAAFAAVVNAKITGVPACCVLSSGAAATQAITAAADAWTDSAPVVFLSAQSRLLSLGRQPGAGPRQLANKEIGIIDIVRSITKYAAELHDVRQFKVELDRALTAATTGRKGPVWLDVPIDLLGQSIDETEQGASPPDATAAPAPDPAWLRQLPEVLRLLATAQRPVILVGHGVRAAQAESLLFEVIDRLQVPVLTSRRGADLVPEHHPLYFGRPGTYGHRAANFIIQNCDLLLSLGARLSLPLVSRNYRAFARAARKIVVDIDPTELAKPTVVPDLAIAADVGLFLRELLAALPAQTPTSVSAWTTRCRAWRKDFPAGGETPPIVGEGVDPYLAMATLAEILPEDAVILAEGGSCVDYVMQSFQFKAGQRFISSSGLEADGFALPGAVGAFLAAPRRRTVCLCEANSFLRSLSEVSALIQRSLPVSIVVLCANADADIRLLQAQYFGGRHVERASQRDTADRALRMFGLLNDTPVCSIRHQAELRPNLEQTLAADGPSLCSLHLPGNHQVAPRMTLTVKADGSWTSRPLEDMYPFLPREVLLRNLLIEPLDSL